MGTTADRQQCVNILAGDNVTILELHGEVDVVTATDFKTIFHESIAEGARRIVVDLSDVTLIDSMGLSVLIGGRRRMEPRGGWLAVACDGDVARVVRLAGLDRVVPLYPTRDEALRGAFAHQL